MRNKINNTILVIISISPFILLCIFYNNIVPLPNTKIIGQYGLVLTKIEFTALVLILSILSYIISGILSKKNTFTYISEFGIKIISCIIFTIFTILLIYKNIQ